MRNPDNRQAIYYKVIDLNEQSDPWIIMVHGFTHNSNYFSAQVSEFQDEFRILLIDLRGHGKSVNVSGPYGVEEYVDDIFAVLDEVGIEKAHYWGTHTGSAIGLVLTLRHPERFTSLVLEGTFLPGFSMPRTGQLINRARYLAHSEGVETALEYWFTYADWFSYMRTNPEECRAPEQRAMLFEFSGLPWLSELTPRPVTPVAEYLSDIYQPVLVYNGESDLEEFKRAALHLGANLPNVQREEISGAGGFPGWENSEVVNRLVRGFLIQQTR